MLRGCVIQERALCRGIVPKGARPTRLMLNMWNLARVCTFGLAHYGTPSSLLLGVYEYQTGYHTIA